MDKTVDRKIRVIEDGAGVGPVCLKQYTEEEWIDWLSGLGGEAKRAEMAAHLPACPSCREICVEWEPILGDGVMGPPDIASEGGGAADGYRTAVPLPSESLRRRLRLRVRLTGMLGTARKFLTRRRVAGALALACALLIAAGWLFKTGQSAGDSWSSYVQQYEPSALPMLSSPDSISYPLDWGVMEPESGMVWYNEASREMLMLVGGLIPNEDQVVHVWAVKAGNRVSLGLLQYHPYGAHLYVRDKEALREADNIVLTIEPKDGKAFGPGSLDAISVDLSGRRD
ncbi:anti-sigma factor [Paenibacillus sp. M1]|uniref:Anti-sigma factor n=1 Tax=Paenibacillus haidiansis TaxID=1574488 RepID=A0ABU7VTF0_9BACL